MLPFSTDAFLGLFATYNDAIWPAQVVAYALGAVALVLAIWPRPGGDRVVAAILAVFWLWTGIVYHGLFFARINFAAPLFGALFAVQGILFGWAALRGRLAFRFGGDVTGWAGLGIALFAMAVYPLLGWAAGHVWPRMPVFGVTPCPTTIFTWGLLLLAANRTPVHLVIVPALWSAIGGSAAWLLEVREDLSLPVAAVLGIVLIAAKNRRARRASLVSEGVRPP
jgi:hypothetical protein